MRTDALIVMSHPLFRGLVSLTVYRKSWSFVKRAIVVMRFEFIHALP